MALERKQRQPDGTFSEPRKIGAGATPDEKVAALGMQLAQEKLSGIQKDTLINGLGAQVAQMKIEIMLMKGGGQ